MSRPQVKTITGTYKDVVGDDAGRLIPGANVGEWMSAIIAASGTSSAAVDLGGHFKYLHIIFPTITSAQVHLTVSDFFTGTYQTLGEGTSGYSETSTGAYSDTWELGGWRYIKVVAGTQTAAENFRVRGITY